jgi:hypothetical protein
MTLWHCQLHCRFAFSDHLLSCDDVTVWHSWHLPSLSRRPLINASTPIRPTGRNSQDFTDAVQSSSALRNVNGTDTADHHWQLSDEWVESRDWKKLYCKVYASNSFKVYQNHLDSPTAARFSRAWCVGLFPDNWEGSIRVGDCSRPAIWKVNYHITHWHICFQERKQGQLVKLVNPHWATDVKPRRCLATLNLADFAEFDWQHWARDSQGCHKWTCKHV